MPTAALRAPLLSLLRSFCACFVLIAIVGGSTACVRSGTGDEATDGPYRVVVPVPISQGPNRRLDTAREAKHFNLFAQAEFEASGEGSYPDGTSGEIQRRAYAQAQARRDALRHLASEILDASPSSRPSLVALFGREQAWLGAMEQCLERSSRVEYESTAAGARATASIEGHAIVRFLSEAHVARTPSEFVTRIAPGSGDFLARREKAREIATTLARNLLYEQVVDDKTETEWFSKKTPPSPEFQARLAQTIGSLAPVQINYDDEGYCTVLMVLPREAVEFE